MTVAVAEAELAPLPIRLSAGADDSGSLVSIGADAVAGTAVGAFDWGRTGSNRCNGADLLLDT